MMLHSFALLLLPVTTLSSRDVVNDIYCHYTKNEFYMPQGDLCKKCDRCAPGFGLEALEARVIEIDPIYGAMECRRCTACPTGYYSKSRSFRECKTCRNCTLEGKVELRKCTSTSNAKCGGPLPLYDMAVSNKEVEVDHRRTEEAENDNSILYILPAIALVLLCVSLLGILYILRRKFIGGKNVINRISVQSTECYDGNHKNEKDPMLLPVSINMACDVVEVDSEPTPPSVFDIWKSNHGSQVILSDEHILYLSKPIATENTFHRLGIKLGIPESDISIIKMDYSSNVVDQAYQTLDKWRKLKGESAAVLEVLNRLRELGRHDIVVEFCRTHP